jgi:ribonuclease HI
MRKIIYTDGATKGNPGPSGWASIILSGQEVKEVGGFEKLSTNNRMELTAVIGALKETKISDQIDIYTDSQYVVNGITKWIFGWIKRKWKTADGDNVMNQDLWLDLFELVNDREINWHVIRGHAGIPGNQRVDDLAVEFSVGNKPKLFHGLIKDYGIDLNPADFADKKFESERDRKKSKAYSYLSLVDGVLEKHSTWTDCENRISGAKGARFRKAISFEDQQKILKEWGVAE